MVSMLDLRLSSPDLCPGVVCLDMILLSVYC